MRTARPKPGYRATLKDVAKAVGVHVSTVSRALNPETRRLITPEIAEKVLAAANRLDYRPNSAAFSLRTKRTMTVGVVVPDITNTVFPPIIRGVEDALAEHGYATVVANTDGRREREIAVLAALAARGVDGLVVASVEREDETIHQLAASGTPVVTANRRMDDPSISSVISDETEGVRLSLVHLAGLGHRRIATIAGNQSLSTGLRRLEAWRRFTAELGLDQDEGLVAYADAFNEASGEQAARMLLERTTGFTAIQCSNDRLAIGAISALRAAGLACPADISVTGFNDMPLVDRIDPPLTTIRIQQYNVGHAAALLLLARMQARGVTMAPEHLVMPVELVVRASTACAHARRAQEQPARRSRTPLASG